MTQVIGQVRLVDLRVAVVIAGLLLIIRPGGLQRQVHGLWLSWRRLLSIRFFLRLPTIFLRAFWNPLRYCCPTSAYLLRFFSHLDHA